MIAKALAAIGRSVLGMLASIGRVSIFAADAVSHLLRPPFYPREFLSALLTIGYFSLPVVGLTALFTGGALALHHGVTVVPYRTREDAWISAWELLVTGPNSLVVAGTKL